MNKTAILSLSVYAFASLSLVRCSGPATVESQSAPGGSEASGGSSQAAATASDANATATAAPSEPTAQAAPATSGGTGKFVLSGTAPANAEGKAVRGALLDAAGKSLATASGTVAKSEYTLNLEPIAAPGAGATVAVYVDVNGDNICNIAPGDLGGKAAVGLGDTVTLNVDAAGQVPCGDFGEFTLTIGGNNFTPHNNQMIYAAVLDVQANVFVSEPIGAKVVNGIWSTAVGRVLVKSRSYEVRYFADLDNSGKCQDHSWLTKVAAVTQDQNLTVSHGDAQTPICTNFPPIRVAAVPAATAAGAGTAAPKK